MMISAFSQASGLPVDTVRFYVRQGLLCPETGTKGGSRPYQMFSQADIDTARVIRLAQALGLTLKQIRAFVEDLSPSERATPRILSFLVEQRDRLHRKVSELQRLIEFLDAKITWINNPEDNTPPIFPA
ncbi:MerR family transcriptional regulator [Lichenihabitans sp. PAMC28606]|uniref:helix-turn-helix domain-containing protein n=1 Tax=Lichenihabitans sp. PAMC28606 TaxID=2880932 RepID=UPI001D0B633F|nr:MerR family transcriptional regulator [Lichenihabitans sp. PAMC28606]UDL94418.1 MerR family transcriptional regulator [Lichenihabitans sp. PAMC28606]